MATELDMKRKSSKLMRDVTMLMMSVNERRAVIASICWYISDISVYSESLQL